MRSTIRKIGNSEGVIIPREMLDRLNLRAGDAVEIQHATEGLTVRPSTRSFEQQMEAARAVMDKYKVALQKLAE